MFITLFLVFVVLMLALDLFVVHKKDREVTMGEAALWTGIWIGLALLFALLLYFFPGMVHGDTGVERGEQVSQFLAGYFLEKSLSIDNIFVMLLIFRSFGVKKEYYHRVLFWGVFGAIVLRFIFIFGLSAVVSRMSWVLAVFGVWLLYSGVKMFFKKDDETMDTANHPAVRIASKYLPFTRESHGHSFTRREAGKLLFTPLFLVLVVIEFSDIVFAVDSIPAVFSVTQDAMIVYTSNIFAILGLRSLFFLVSHMADRFWLLHYGLGALLSFIGLKMLAAEFLGLEMSAVASLLVILTILAISIVLSLVIRKEEK